MPVFPSTSSLGRPVSLVLFASQVLPVLGRVDRSGNFDGEGASRRIREAWDAYNLPYGTLGMVSHAVLLWAMACHLVGRWPLCPLFRLRNKIPWLSLLNIVIVLVTSIVTLSIAGSNLPAVSESSALRSLVIIQMVYGIIFDGIVIHRYFRDTPRENWFRLKRPAGHKEDGTTEEPERHRIGWDLSPWMVALVVASFVNSQIIGTRKGALFGFPPQPPMVSLTVPNESLDIKNNPKIDGAFYFDRHTGQKNSAGIALTICAMVGGVLAALTFVGGCFCIPLARRNKDYSRLDRFSLYVFTLFGLVSCVGFILAADYIVSLVTGNMLGRPYLKRGGQESLFWTFFVFQFFPLLTF
ncbi:hypothetical protein VTJ83DRAFT_2657 [Remersonia thermophila]|uniref:Transmembrane protein n=1 Tax=Remersonia thermophila TaxID=72144 RepID=A0ABR4DJC4_9PEZI